MYFHRIVRRTVDPPVTRENTVARIENPPLADVVQRSPFEILRGVYTVGSMNPPKPCASGAKYALCWIYDYSAEQPVWIEVPGSLPLDLAPGCVRLFEFSPVFVEREQTVPYLVATPLEHQGCHRSPLELMNPHDAASPEDLKRLVSLVNDLQEPALAAFLETVFAEPDLLKAFCTIGANRRYHHTERGGLLRHSLEASEGVRNALRTDGETNGLEDEAAIVVALIHDLGRVRLADPAAYDVYGHHGPKAHEWVLLEMVRPSLETLKYTDSAAYSALWGTLHAYVARNRYQNPRVGLIQSMDGHSAQKDIQASRGAGHRLPTSWAA